MSLIATVGPTGGVKNRLNIVDFVKNEKFFTLYVRSLELLQAKEQHDYSSFFQLAGIHGLPFTEWAKERPSMNLYKAGYCTHGQVLFPTWHRTYLSVFEQILQGAAIEVANKFTSNQTDWIQAAQDLRQPYWDWGFELMPPDEVIKNEEVNITNYDGKKISVKNPILRYHFHPIDPSFKPYGDFATWRTTVRNPDRNRREDIPGLIKKMRLEEGQIREKTYNMLKFNDAWERFSNHGISDDQHANSLESVHDDIHVMVGYGKIEGHMDHPFFAAFDPIFWLHHTNVDRLLSLWKAINPDVWVTSGRNRDGTMGIAPNAQINDETPLEPFYQSEDKVWTSASLADTARLGYSYPDFDKLVGGTKELIRDAIDDLIDERYGSKPSSGARNTAFDLLADFKGITKEHKEDLKMYDWTIHVAFKKFELKESFSLLFYFASDGGDYDQENCFVGSINAFRGTTPETCANCQDNENLIQEGFIHLNHYLARDLESFEPQDVHKFLKEKGLSYKLYSREDKSLTSLSVKIEGRPLHLPPGEHRPKYDHTQDRVVFDDVAVHVIN
ncbi:tyrosinase [Agaricus bisporus var. bisporus H97]|uniref:tyrosinase n=1 Tax=Agaricus bisporus var. bisporus (strain H97 / ATCC MYA-4626 / FGSC 10389) TaxID=936046 RepID=UPI00029F7A1B|nr:tyrosinase [Agaricus bisporus var. bisporus H97]EKV49554.1 tyrosinase [Agaricus bisporus var. bisporus H97]